MRHMSSKWGMWIQFWNIWFPIFLTQVMMIAGSFCSTAMAGQHSEYDLAGVSVGVNLWLPILLPATGIFAGITPLIGQKLGFGRRDGIPEMIRQSAYVAGIIGILVMGGCFFLLPFIVQALGLDAQVQEIANRFLFYIGWGIIPTFLAVTFRNIIDAHGETKMSLVVMSMGFVVNVLLNYCLIYGRFGFPELGGAGTGLAISVSNAFNCVIFSGILFARRPFSEYAVFHRWDPVNVRLCGDQLRIGIPIGLANFLEISSFTVVGLLITQFGTSIIAAHQAAYNFSELIYTLPMSVGIAATILCSFSLGGKQIQQAYRYARLAQLFTVAVSAFLFVWCYYEMSRVASIYTSDDRLAALISTFIPLAMCFNLADAFGVPIQGALRGYKDVRFVLGVALITYWGVGIGGGIFLEYVTPWGPYAYWFGNIGSVFVAAFLYNMRLRWLQKKLSAQ